MIFDEKELRQCFSLFATGVMIATVNYQEKLCGLTINSFSSVSLKPPLLLFSIANQSSNLEIFRNSKSYSLNILSKNQLNLALEFAKANNEAKWQVEKYDLTKNNNPVFQNSIAFFECVHHKIVEAGDHHIFIGEIIDFAKIKDEDGLFYYKSNFL